MKLFSEQNFTLTKETLFAYVSEAPFSKEFENLKPLSATLRKCLEILLDGATSDFQAQRPRKCSSGCPGERKVEGKVGEGRWGGEKRPHWKRLLVACEVGSGPAQNTRHYPVHYNYLFNSNILLHFQVINFPIYPSRHFAPACDVFLEASGKAGSILVRMSARIC